MLDNISLFTHEAVAVNQLTGAWGEWREKVKSHPILSESEDGITATSTKILDGVDAFKEVILSGKPVSIRFSGGKDSTCVVILFLLAAVELKKAGAYIPPNQVIASANTRSENPEVANLLQKTQAEIRNFCQLHDLPVTVITATPRLGQTLVGRIITGRGLPSYPTKSAQCAVERKIAPMNNTLRNWYKERGIKKPNSETVLVLGSRISESDQRKRSMLSFGAKQHVSLSKKSKALEFYPIAEWLVSDIWKTLSIAGTQRGIIPAFMSDFSEISTFYSSSTGECVFMHTDDVNKKQESCSARTGCFDCVRMAQDKSLEQLIESDSNRYGYLRPLNKIRNFIWNIQHDWSRRNLLGRTATNGFSRLRPDVFSFQTCRTLLAALITADYDEYNRAQHVAQQLSTGEIEANEVNLRLAKPQFCFVKPEDVICCEFLWSLHTFNVQPFEAVMLYHNIWHKGDTTAFERLDGDSIPITLVKKTPHPKGDYLFVGDETLNLEARLSGNISCWDTYNGYENLGLRNVMNEFCELETPTLVETKTNSFFIQQYEIGEYFSVDSHQAALMVAEPEWYLNVSANRLRLPQSSAITFLSKGVVTLGKGKEYLYHQMCLRAQKYNAMGLVSGMSWSDIDLVRENCRDLVLTEQQYNQHKLKLAKLCQQWQIWLLVIALNKADIEQAIANEEQEKHIATIAASMEDAFNSYDLAAKKRLKKENNWRAGYAISRKFENLRLHHMKVYSKENHVDSEPVLLQRLLHLNSTLGIDKKGKREIAYIRKQLRVLRLSKNAKCDTLKVVEKRTEQKTVTVFLKPKSENQLALF